MHVAQGHMLLLKTVVVVKSSGGFFIHSCELICSLWWLNFKWLFVISSSVSCLSHKMNSDVARGGGGIFFLSAKFKTLIKQIIQIYKIDQNQSTRPHNFDLKIRLRLETTTGCNGHQSKGLRNNYRVWGF